MQAAFTTKELRELTKLGIAELVVWRHELERGLTNASQTELKKGRAQKRMAKILDGAVRDFEARSNGGSSSIERRVVLRFLQSPVALIKSEQHPGRVGAVTLQPNQLEGEAGPIHTTRPYIYIYIYIYLKKGGHSTTEELCQPQTCSWGLPFLKPCCFSLVIVAQKGRAHVLVGDET